MHNPADVVCVSNAERRPAAWLVSLLLAALAAGSASAQVSVTATGGTPGPTPYTTLKEAFDAINAGTHQDAVTVSITGDTNEGTASAVLNASGAGSASYTSVLITPSGGAPRTITGATTAGTPLIDLNGADNVTIDGLNTGGDALTIANTTVASTSGTSTIRFQADATNNVVTNASILGSSTMTSTTSGGTIWFGSAAVAVGNDNNTVSNCNIGPAGTSLPAKAVFGSGTTTNTTLYNNGIVITGNNIFDYFHPTATSHGLYLAGGNSDWTISNNRFFQTATRTQTTGATHAGIQVASTNNNNHLISGNVIGYASAAGTGTYTFVGASSSSKFLPIYFSSAGTTTPTSIQGNVVTAVSLSGVVGGTSTTGAFVGLAIGSGRADIGTVTGNIVGSLTVPGAISVSSNNASAMEVMGIYYLPSQNVTIANNSVGGITAANSGAGNLSVYGIRSNVTTTVTSTIQNNTVGSAGAPISVSSSAAGSRVAGIYSQDGASVVTGNTVRNLSANVPNPGTGSTASVIGLWSDNAGATAGNDVARNTIHSLGNTHATAAVAVTGLHYNGSATGTHVVQRNFVHSLVAPSTSAAATVTGIYAQAGTTAYQNNMVAVGNELAADSPQIYGIHEAGGTNNFHHNSVYVGGSAVAAGTSNSFAFQSLVTANTREYRDNIFFNARSNGAATGKHYAVTLAGTAPNPAGLTSNNNVLFANGVGGVTGLFNALDQATLGDWQAATGQDGNSFSSNPQYAAPAAATPDLHINPLASTVIEGNGFPIASVTVDFDGETRGGLTPTDIGADAGNFIGTDLAPPVIDYTPFANTAVQTNRTLTATISDVTGVATLTLAPRVYYNKNAGAYFSQACTLAGGTPTNGTWDCVVNYADVGGVTAGDVIAYFVIAQDVLGNLDSNPAGAVATDVNNVSSPPPAPDTYTVVPGFSGSLNIGAGETYTSLTNDGGIFQAINGGALAADLVLNITSDISGELGTHALGEWLEDGAGGYSLLIKPGGAPRTVTGSNTGALFRLNGADRVRIDGSTFAALGDAPGSGPVARELTLENTHTATTASVVAVQSGPNGAQNNTLANFEVLGQSSTSTLYGISLGGTTPGTVGTDNDGNRVENVRVRRVTVGIYSAGQNAANPNTGTVITHNDLSAAGSDRVRRVGIVASNEDGIQITGNHVGGIETNESFDAIGIAVGTTSISTTTTTAGGITNAVVARNRVSGVRNTSTSGFAAAGITLAAATGGTNTLANNMITGVISPATSPDVVAGIFVAGVTGSNAQLFHNSVSMTGERGAAASQYPSYGLAVTGTNPTVLARNNLFHNTQNSAGGANAKSYAVGLVTTAFTNLDTDWNGFFVRSVNFGGFRSGSLSGGAGTDYATLAAWQAAVSDDANSFEADPLFISTADLHLQPDSPALTAGTPLVSVTEDYDGDARSATAPDVGADELFPRPADLSITKTDGVTTALPGGSVTYTITASNAGPGDPFGATVTDTFAPTLTCTWTCVGSGGGTCSAAGSGDIADPVNLPVGATVTYTATCNVDSNAGGLLLNSATVTGSAGDPDITNNNALDADVLVPVADLAITKDDGLGTATPGTPVTYTITVNNFGPSRVTATVTDPFPAELINCAWTCTPSGGATCPAAGSGAINHSVSVPVGGTLLYSATCDIDPAAIGNLANTASVSSTASDPDTSNNSSTDSNTLTPLADVSVAQTDGPDPIGVHRNLTYDVTASNAGPSDAADLTLTDTLPAGTTFVSATPGEPTCTHGAGVVTCNLGVLGAGAGTVVSIVTTTSAPGSLTNTAEAGSTTSDPDMNNNSAGEDTTVKFLKGDINNDLATDLFIANTLTGEHRVWKMEGVEQAADQALNPSSPASATQRSVGVADFNGDFRNDIVFWDSATGAVEFWLMDDVDRQGGPVPIGNAPTLSANWKLSATADFNHDGQTDIVWRNVTSQKIVIWTMNGTDKLGNIVPSPDQAADANWEIVGALDFDDDGNTDFLWYNSSSGNLVQWLMDANVVRTTGRFTVPPSAGNSNWKVLAASDYGIGPGGIPNSNDVVWRNAVSGKFVVWHLDFAGVRTAGIFTNPDQPAGTPTDWTIVGPR